MLKCIIIINIRGEKQGPRTLYKTVARAWASYKKVWVNEWVSSVGGSGNHPSVRSFCHWSRILASRSCSAVPRVPRPHPDPCAGQILPPPRMLRSPDLFSGHLFFSPATGVSKNEITPNRQSHLFYVGFFVWSSQTIELFPDSDFLFGEKENFEMLP